MYNRQFCCTILLVRGEEEWTCESKAVLIQLLPSGGRTMPLAGSNRWGGSFICSLIYLYIKMYQNHPAKNVVKCRMEEMWLCRINKQVDLGYFVYTEYFGSSWQCSLMLLRLVYSLLLDFIVSLGFYGFSGSHVWMWELDYKESWVPKNWCFWTVVLEKTLESPLDCKEITPVHPKGNQSWVFIFRTGAEAETPILWPPDAKSWLIWKDPDAGIDGRQEE